MEDNKLYTTLFNAVTDALRALEKRNYGSAEEILIHAQLITEGMFIGEKERKGKGRKGEKEKSDEEEKKGVKGEEEP